MRPYYALISSNERVEQKVRWFRARANRDRFREEVDILHAELERTKATFARMKTVWEGLSARIKAGGEGAAAHSQSRVQLGKEAYAAKQASIYAQWAEDARMHCDEAERVRSGGVIVKKGKRARDGSPKKGARLMLHS